MPEKYPGQWARWRYGILVAAVAAETLIAAGLFVMCSRPPWKVAEASPPDWVIESFEEPITIRLDALERQCPPAAPIMRGEIRAIVDMLGDLVSHPPMTCAYGAVRTTEYEASWRCLTEAEVATITKLERS